jgi:hypothetical protein
VTQASGASRERALIFKDFVYPLRSRRARVGRVTEQVGRDEEKKKEQMRKVKEQKKKGAKEQKKSI